MASPEDERVDALIQRILELKNIMITGTKYTVEVGVQVEQARVEIAAIWTEIRDLRSINSQLVEAVEAEAPTLPDNPIPLIHITE